MLCRNGGDDEGVIEFSEGASETLCYEYCMSSLSYLKTDKYLIF